jgi:hypothetical protein
MPTLRSKCQRPARAEPRGPRAAIESRAAGDWRRGHDGHDGQVTQPGTGESPRRDVPCVRRVEFGADAVRVVRDQPSRAFTPTAMLSSRAEQQRICAVRARGKEHGGGRAVAATLLSRATREDMRGFTATPRRRACVCWSAPEGRYW